MSKESKNEDLSQYKTKGLSLLQLMGLLVITGIVVTVVLRHFFG